MYDSLWKALRARYWSKGPDPSFLLGVMMWMPFCIQAKYCEGGTSLAVASMMTVLGM